MDQKRCSKCGELKALSEFHKKRASRDGVQTRCKLCLVAASKQERQEHPERVAARQKRWREAHSEKEAARKKQYREANHERLLASEKQYRDTHGEQETARQGRYYAENPEKCAARHKRWVQAHSEQNAAYQREYREANREEAVAYTKRWREKNPEQCAATQHRRRARKAAATIEKFNIMEVWEYWGWLCAYCGSTENLTIDHIVALADGGSHSLDNLTVACMSCNCSKGAKPLIEWLSWKTRLQRQLGQC